MQLYGCLLLPQYRGKLDFGGVNAQDLAISPVNINSSLSDLLQELKGVRLHFIAHEKTSKDEFLIFWLRNIGKIKPEKAKSAEFRERWTHCKAIPAWNFTKICTYTVNIHISTIQKRWLQKYPRMMSYFQFFSLSGGISLGGELLYIWQQRK